MTGSRHPDNQKELNDVGNMYFQGAITHLHEHMVLFLDAMRGASDEGGKCL